MATKKQVEAAAKKRWPKSWLEVGYTPSSPSMRAACSERCRQLREAKDAAYLKVQEFNKNPTLPALLHAARFVCDVNGDPTAVEQLYVALRAAEAERDARDDYREARAEFEKRWSGGSLYYKYAIYRSCAMGLAKTPICQADSLNELLEKISDRSLVVY